MYSSWVPHTGGSAGVLSASAEDSSKAFFEHWQIGNLLEMCTVENSLEEGARVYTDLD